MTSSATISVPGPRDRVRVLEVGQTTWAELMEQVAALLGYDVLETVSIESDAKLHGRLVRDLHGTTEADLLSHEDLFGSQ